MSVDGTKLFCTLLVESDALRHMTGRKQPTTIRFDCRDRISCTFHVSGCGPQLRSHLKGFWIREQLFLEIPSLHLFSLDNQCEFIHSGSQFFLKRCPGFCTWWCPALRMSQHSFVSQSDWLVVPGCLSSLVSLHLFPNLAHGVRLSGCLSLLFSL